MMKKSALSAAVFLAAGLAAIAPVRAQQAPTEDRSGQTMPAEEQEGLTEEMRFGVAEEHVTNTLEPGDPHRVYVLDPVFPHLIASKVWVYDGDDGALLGMMNTGYVPNLVLGKDHQELYVAETFWSRGTRGERADVVTRYDPTTLSPTGEIELPAGRFLVVTKRHDADLSPDGRYLYSFNLAPSTSISVVDLQENEYKGEIEIPGCALVFPTGERSFASICSDGSLLRATFDEALAAEIDRTEPFFDAENDPVFEHAGFDREENKLHLVTYSGRYYGADLSGQEMSFSEPWDFIDEEARAEGWRPGGWQMMSYHQDTDRLYVTMHQGEDWTHKAAGHQVWELDPAAKQVLRKLELEEEAMSIAVTRDEQPLLVTLSESASVVTYDLASGEPKARVEGIGDSPFILMVEGN
jgi:methylamine dehydrogenase heavy chain